MSVTTDPITATSRRRWHTSVAAALSVLALVATGCSSTTSDADDELGSSDPAATGTAAAVDAALSDLSAAMALQSSPYADYDEAIAVTERVEEELTVLLDELPSPPADELARELEAAARDWRAGTVDAREELIAGRDDWEPENHAWVEGSDGDGPDGPPPVDFTTVLDRVLVAGPEALGDACAAWAVASGTAIDCYRLTEAPREGDTDDPFATGDGSVDEVIVVGGLEVRVRASGLFGVEATPDSITLDPDMPGALAIGAAPDVVDHGGPVGGSLDATQPWPDDLGAWARQLPVEVVEQRSEDLPSGTWEVIVLIATDEPFAITELPGGDAIVVDESLPVVLAATELDGTTLAAVSRAPNREVEGFLGFTLQTLADLAVTPRS